MSNYTAAAGLLALTLGLGACATQTHGPGGVAYDTNRGASRDVGATSQGAGGSVSGGTQPSGEKEQRGNTPPGLDRDGHGPAAGAIIDPTGAVTGRKP
jgi:hypothetical protein